MTPKEIDEIALKVLSRREDTCDYSWGEFVESVREVIAEIQRTQEPTLMMNSVHNTEAVLEDQTSGFDIPLFTLPPAPVVPEGWQLVPKEITPAMLMAFHDAYREHNNSYPMDKIGRSSRCYKAMLAAAPEYKGDE